MNVFIINIQNGNMPIGNMQNGILLVGNIQNKNLPGRNMQNGNIAIGDRGGDSSADRESDWKAGILRLVWVLQSTASVHCLTVCAVACINICVCTLKIKNKNKNYPKHWHLYHCLDTRKYYTYRYEWVALLLRLLCITQLWQPEFSARYNIYIKKE